MGMPIPVSITNDLAMPVIPLGMTFHDYACPPSPPVPCAPCVEPPVGMMWPPGYGLFQNKLTTTVLHKAMPLVQDGHNCGYMLPHISIPPSNMLTPLQMAFSSRKVAFSASKVKANGTPLACVFPSFIVPGTCCAQPMTMPNQIALLNCLNTVYVGLSFADWIIGVVSIVATMIVDKLLYKKPEALDRNALIDKMLDDAKWKLLFGDKWDKNLAKNKLLWKTLTGVLVGAAKIAFTGEGSVSLSIGSNYLGASFSFSKTKEGDMSISVSASAAAHQASYKGTSKANGESTSTTATRSVELSNKEDRWSDGASDTTSTSTTTRGKDGNVKGTSETETNTKLRDNPWSGSTDIDQQKTTTKPEGTSESAIHAHNASSWGKPL